MRCIYPSLLAADPKYLHESIITLNPYCAGFHIDSIDDSYAPTASWEPEEVNTLSTFVRKKVWVHLMVKNPLTALAALTVPPGSIVTFHIETKYNKKEILDLIKEKKWLASIAISPKTPIQEVFGWLDDIYQVLVMSVEPGFTGQPFLKDTISKLDPLRAYRATAGLPFRIGIDGGIDAISIGLLKNKGIDDFVVGAAVFKSHDQIEALKIIQDLVDKD